MNNFDFISNIPHNEICVSLQDFDDFYYLVSGPSKIDINMMGTIGHREIYIGEKHVPVGHIKIAIRKFPSGNVVKDWSLPVPFNQIDCIDKYLKLKFFW